MKWAVIRLEPPFCYAYDLALDRLLAIDEPLSFHRF